MKTLYRYRDTYTSNGVTIECQQFDVVKETPHFYFFCPRWCSHWPDFRKQYIKRTSKTARSRFAYPTKEEALNSYRIRKDRQLGHLKLQLAVTLRAIHALKSTTVATDKINCGKPKYFEKLSWG